MTILKLAPATDWFSADDFPQGTTVPNSYIPNMLLAFGLVRHTIRYWAWGSRFIEIDGLGLNTMPVQYIYIYI